MNATNHNPNIRKGRFLWLDDTARTRYVEKLSKRVSDGYYNSEKIINKLVEEMAPVFNDAVENEP